MTDSNITMLSIDDSTVTTELDRAGYRKMGVVIRAASSFNAAEKILAEQRIDIIVINRDFGKIDALSMCKHFKAQPKLKGIPIVLTSVQGSPTKVQQALDAQADLFIEQPMPRPYFIEKLKSLLDQTTRSEDRISYEGEVNFTFKGKEYQCVIGDLSRSGLLLNTDTLKFEPGDVLELEFDLPGNKKPITVKGEVVRKITEKEAGKVVQIGFGVKFQKLADEAQRRLEKHLLKTKTDDPKLAYYL